MCPCGSQRQPVVQRLTAAAVHLQIGIGGSTEIQDMAICITWKDEQVDVVKIEILIVKGQLSKSAELVRDINTLISKSNKRIEMDPFTATTKMSTPRSDILGAAEIDRNHMVSLEMIGSGMFGEVFLANQHLGQANTEENAEERAVKTLRKGSNDRQRREFCDEAEIQLCLKHANIVRVTGVCMLQEPYLCVLEFMP